MKKIKFDDLLKMNPTPEVHGNGFIILRLRCYPEVRLDIWSPDLQHQTTNTEIHDHRFGFVSKVLLGVLNHVEYKVEEFKEYVKNKQDILSRSDLFYKCKCEKITGGLQETKLIMNMNKIFKVSERQNLLLKAGSIYRFEPYKFHCSKGIGLTATLLKKEELDKEYIPYVLCQISQQPDNEYSRYKYEVTYIWQIIKKVFDEIGSIELE